MPNKEGLPGIGPDDEEIHSIGEMEVYKYIFPHLTDEDIDLFRKDVRSGALGVPPEKRQEVLDRLDEFLAGEEELPLRESPENHKNP